MNYSCANCGRAFLCEETISFCPFCGRAYIAAGDRSGAPTQRIVIGSDSERVVQEKYWKRAQSGVNTALLRLRRGLPRFAKERKVAPAIKVPREYQFVPVKIRDYLSLKHCSSIATFKNRLSDYISALDRNFGIQSELLSLAEQNQQKYRKEIAARRLSLELGEWSIVELEDEYSVDIEREGAFIDDFCRDLAEAVGCMSPERLRPELDCDSDSIDWSEILKGDEGVKALPKLTPAHLALLDAIKKVLPLILRIVEENGLFAISAVSGEADEEFDPASEAAELLALAERDYDPIFGEPPEELIEAFSLAVIDMSQFESMLPNYVDLQDAALERQLERLKRKLDDIKLRALYGYIDKWRNALDQELDRAYQGQNEDMVNIYNAVERLAETLEEK